jgi:NAD(P)-dependent dehydrogenase (short-subunit alcohol dehydrogenase family)
MTKDEATDEDRHGPSGRVTLVTGGTDGIGRAVAMELARRGDRVLVVGRDRGRGHAVVGALREAQPDLEHAFLHADLSLLQDTARLADDVSRRTERLDAVVFCAGILSLIPEWTAERLERNFVLNYLSRYLLARCVLPMLAASPSGRVVLVANAGKYPDTLDFADLQHRRGKSGLRVAGRTQFANDLLAVELAERVRGTRVEVTCVYPGVVKTAVFRNARGLPWPVRAIALVAQKLFGMTPASAARIPVHLAQSPRAENTNGSFFGPKLAPRPVPDRARRSDRRLGLWNASEELVRPFLPGSKSERGWFG